MLLWEREKAARSSSTRATIYYITCARLRNHWLVVFDGRRRVERCASKWKTFQKCLNRQSAQVRPEPLAMKL